MSEKEIDENRKKPITLLLSFSIYVFVIEKFLFDLLNIECFLNDCEWPCVVANHKPQFSKTLLSSSEEHSNFRQKYNNIERKKMEKNIIELHLLEQQWNNGTEKDSGNPNQNRIEHRAKRCQ